MAQRFGGEFSPQKGAKAPYAHARRARAGARVNFLFLAPLPLAIMAFFRPPTDLALSLGAFGLLILAAWLTREGLKAEEAYMARKIARRTAIPRKIFASLLTGAGLFGASMLQGTVLTSALMAILGAGLHFAAFGPDPLKNKGMDGLDEFQTDRVARAVEKAEKHLVAMQDAISPLHDRQLEGRVAGFAEIARDMFRTIEDDPRDLTAARKFLVVYLKGARDASVKFADLYARNHDASARADFEALLDDLEGSFAAKTQAFLTDNRTDLDVEMEVLRERLAREGVALERLNERDRNG
ncbi:MAG TPA: hypothetical protein ENK83_07855 [Aliiroseovarius sp.]|nr:hypothetical protein [Aliiroseovarius sp.]